jgi:4-deoxy-L-threo-5-hexosulose-uronate ketol-isomerase
MTTGQIRARLLIDGLFTPGAIEMVYTDLDRLIAGGIMPGDQIALPAFEELGSSYFTERREIGIINIGDAGEVRAGGISYPLGHLDCLYIGVGEPDISFRNAGGGQAAFYLLSAPAHRKFPTCAAGIAQASVQEIGTAAHASRRKLVRYIHEEGIQSCQLVMGYTAMEEGSVWNTWPPHTHARRSEIYLYFGLGENHVIHLAGEPAQTRHVVVREKQAVASPPWSVHTGAGTGPYSFVWGMAGENRAFADMDAVALDRFA